MCFRCVVGPLLRCVTRRFRDVLLKGDNLNTVERPGTASESAERSSSLSIDYQEGCAIVCVSDLIWDEHWSSEQQLMSRLADRSRVLYVERPVSLLSVFTQVSDAPIGRQFWRFLQGGLRRERDTLWILTIPPVLPLRFFRLTNSINEAVRGWAIRRALKKLAMRKPVLWIYSPEAGRLVGKFGERFSLYYCADDWAAFDQWWNRAADVRAREGELASKVNLIVGTSTKLVAKWAEKYRDVLLVSNGADVNAFKKARDESLEEPEDLRGIPSPRVGYIGFVDERFDTRLYEKLCASQPGWSFVIIGPVQERHLDLSVLKRMGNVHFLGPRTRDQLPAYLKGLDVCTIPYIVNTLSESIFPLKLFEYLAAGRPTVTTALPELLPFVDHIRIGRTHDEFIKNVGLSLTRPLATVSEGFLDQNSWDTKADLLWERLSQTSSQGLDVPRDSQ
jgi:glycosyltransferase involved in cell wall biosynthesis